MQQEQSTSGMDNDPDSDHTERQIPQPLQAGIPLEPICDRESPPPYNECVQMQLTPYSYFEDDKCHSGENQKPENDMRSSTGKFNDT